MNDFNLEKQPKITPGFKVSEGFFDAFSEKVLPKIIIEHQRNLEPKVISIFTKTKKWILTAAATLVILFTASYYFTNAQQKKETAILENYLVQQTNLTEEDIAGYLTQSDFEKIEIEYNLEQNVLENIDLELINLEENL